MKILNNMKCNNECPTGKDKLSKTFELETIGGLGSGNRVVGPSFSNMRIIFNLFYVLYLESPNNKLSLLTFPKQSEYLINNQLEIGYPLPTSGKVELIFGKQIYIRYTRDGNGPVSDNLVLEILNFKLPKLIRPRINLEIELPLWNFDKTIEFGPTNDPKIFSLLFRIKTSGRLEFIANLDTLAIGTPSIINLTPINDIIINYNI